MTSSALLAQVLRLPPDERLKLIAQIWDSLDTATAAPLTAALIAELDRREAEADADPSAGTTWADIRSKLQGNCGKRVASWSGRSPGPSWYFR